MGAILRGRGTGDFPRRNEDPMFRPGTDELNVQYEDVLCNFCRRAWDPDDPARPFVEGHHGSHICGECLSLAYLATVLEGRDDRRAGEACTMCLIEPDLPFWRSPEFPDARICRACVKRSSGTLEKDKDYTWKPPCL
jgi:hypothetical protein